MGDQTNKQPESVRPALSNDEITVLLIAAQGQAVAQIGRWEQPLQNLIRQGLMSNEKFNSVITIAGLDAVEAYEKESDQALKQVLIPPEIKIEDVVRSVAKDIAEFSSAYTWGDAAIEQYAFDLIMKKLVLPS